MAIISLSGRAGSGKDTAGRIIQWRTSGSLKSYEDYFSSTKDGVHFNLPESQLYKSKWTIKKWAGPLRKVAAILLGMDEQFLYTDEFKQMVLPECWATTELVPGCEGECELSIENDTRGHSCINGSYCYHPKERSVLMSGRQFLQRLGTDAIRNGLHEQSWVNALMSEYKLFDNRSFQDPATEDTWPNWIITDTRFPNELAAVKKVGGITIRLERDIYTEFDGVHLRSKRNPAFDGPEHPSETALDTAEFDHIIDNNGTISDLAEKLNSIISNLNSHANDSTTGKGG